MTTKIFVAFSVIFLALIGAATYRDQASRDYLSIQTQYAADHPHPDGSTFPAQVQQLFPSFSDAKVGDTFRVERCISCHVPDIQQIGPEQAAKNLALDFQKYEPNAAQMTKDYSLTLQHPAYVTIDSNCLPASGATPASPAASPSPSPSTSPGTSQSSPASPIASPGSSPSASVASATVRCDNGTPAISYAEYGSSASLTFAGPQGKPPYTEPGYLPASINPQNATGGKVGIDQIGCVVCHNGSRLLTTADNSDNSANRGGHTNLVVNPTYVWTKGASLYYQYCVACHAQGGAGNTGPPLSNQDRLGFFNEDYYYRCIEYGMTGFEHVGSAMPNWGSVSPDYTGTKPPVNGKRVLSEAEINILVQFIRHWETYKTLP